MSWWSLVLNLPTNIEDVEIIEKLHKWGVIVTSPVKRRMWPGTRIVDGTRFVSVKFNEVQSLPYSLYLYQNSTRRWGRNTSE